MGWGATVRVRVARAIAPPPTGHGGRKGTWVRRNPLNANVGCRLGNGHNLWLQLLDRHAALDDAVEVGDDSRRNRNSCACVNAAGHDSSSVTEGGEEVVVIEASGRLLLLHVTACNIAL